MQMDFLFTLPPFLAALLCFGVGYGIGSIPFGLVLTKWAGLGDIRSIGSGNIGATNVLRTGKKHLAFLTLLLDGGKGAFVVWLAQNLGGDMPLIAGFGALLGHLFPVWLKFKGGKGVATTLGTLLALSWPVGGLACLTWLIVAAVFRYSSLSALLAVALTPFYALLFASPALAVWCALVAGIVIAKHHTNIRRLIAGTEPKIGKKGP
jgi:acyl phosphate:glycerol-3-phosphate acyltransferase